jgi:hypothetical protein
MSLRRLRRAWRGIGEYFPEGLALVIVLVSANVIGSVTASHLIGYLVRACAIELPGRHHIVGCTKPRHFTISSSPAAIRMRFGANLLRV